LHLALPFKGGPYSIRQASLAADLGESWSLACHHPPARRPRLLLGSDCLIGAPKAALNFNRRFSVAPFNFRTHTREMDNDKQKGSVWDGITVAFRIIEAAETLNSGRSGFDEFVHGVKEKVLMGAAITAVCGVFYVMVFVFHW
jgi:hypothetical protein